MNETKREMALLAISRMWRMWFAVLVVGALSMSAGAADWYVATNGLDSAPGDGSLAHPYATVAKAVTSSSASDTIHLLPGTYTQSGISVGKVLTITGNNSTDTILQAAAMPNTATDRILSFTANANVQNLTLQNGKTAGDGGAIYAFTPGIWVSNCTFLANRAGGNGGAIARSDYGSGTYPVTILDSTFASNSAAGVGGAIYAAQDSALVVSNSTIASNTAGTYGGGFYSAVKYGAATGAYIYNSTVYGNRAAVGGAAYHWSNAAKPLFFYNSTVVNNVATNGNGGSLCIDAGYNYTYMIQLYSSIVASNSASGLGPDIFNAAANWSQGVRSLVGNNADSQFTAGNPDANGNYIGTSGSPINPGLQPLANNGGARMTCALSAGSVAIDHGTNILNLAYDERGAGFPRVVGTQCDIGAYELKTLVYSGTVFYETLPASDGSISNAITVTVAGDTFNATPGENLVTSGKVATNHVPAGLSVVITNISSTQVVVTLTGNASPNDAGASVANLTLNFLDSAFGSGSAASVPGASRADLGVTFYGASANRSLSYNLTNFTESVANDGTIGNTLTVTLHGDTFNASPGATFANVPTGLTPVVTKLSDLTVSITFSGSALTNRVVNNVTNLTVTFLDSAFFGGSASTVSNYTRADLQMTFLDPVVTYGGDTFSESAANDGSMGNTLTITLGGDTFNATNGENLVASGKVTTNNVPAGLTAVVARTGAQTATVSLTGKASPHNAANNAANLTIAFVDAAFSNGVAAVVTNATRSNLKVNFLNPNLAYSGTAFNESPTSPGVIPNTLTVTLAGDTFSTVSQDLVGAGKTTVGNVPTGLQAVITTLSTTQATFSLTGVANPNEAANSTNLVVTFLGTAFTGGNAAIVTNATVNNVAVNFVSPKDWYVATNGTDSAPGDGSQAHPYATVQKAVDMAQSAANDVIHLLPGTYTQSGINIGSKLLTIAGDTSADTILQAASTPFTASAGILGGMNAGGYIRNLTFRYGNAGTGFGSAGAVGCAGDVYFDNCVFATNACGAEGGAVWANTTATLTFRNCLFAGNRAGGGGGAVYVWSANLAVSNCTFLANTAATFGGALFRDHEGAIANVAVYDSLFSGNAATNSGGAIYGAKDSRFAIWNSTLASNRAVTGVGGAIFSRMNDGSVTCQVYNSTIALNTAGGGGGAVYMWTQSDRSVNLYNCTVFANGASTNGGGLYLDVYGGNQRYYNLISSIVASNTAGTAGPDIYANGGGAGTVTNSILGSDANAGNGLTEGNPNAGGSYVGTSGSPINPLLAPLANNGGKWPTCALLPGSPAIDHGLNPLGLLWDERGAGYARAYKTLPDMGAFEYGAHLPVTGLVIYFQ